MWQAIALNVGTESAAIDIVEHTTLVTTVQASDPQPNPVFCSITEGADAALFGMNHLSGELPFLGAADFEDPGDTDLDNFCKVIVPADDASSVQTGRQSISVTVNDVNEAPAFAGGALAGAVYREGRRLGVGLTGEASGDLTCSPEKSAI
ncbi:cadherin repeat domain-containing protein [Cribrihabitans neustonicus]|uniref:cadherin repeat domain-containing protein n=1 Tax=Cribrihabitans neustonicus TaxID=1429085 RepID=UPI003B5CAB44